MTAVPSLKRWFFRTMPSVCLGIFLLGCATAKTDWTSRVGQYTYDQAVLELGPPEKLATLTEGTKVAEWLTTRGYARGSFTTFGGSFYYGGPWIHHYAEAPSPDHFLRLTFSPDGKLNAWQRVLK